MHGVGRNGRDFDVLGEALAATHRVLAVDMPGRGESDWLADPNDYVFPTYLTTLIALIARSGAETVDWIGTSMGGLLGIVDRGTAEESGRAARRQRRRARHRAGGARADPGLLRRSIPTFATYDEIERYIRTVSAPFGRLTDAQWEHVTRTNVRQRPDGRWRLAYDPGIAVPVPGERRADGPVGCSGMRSAVPRWCCAGRSPTCCRPRRLRRWRRAGRSPAVVEFADVGHAPMLLSPEQIEPVARFLRS